MTTIHFTDDQLAEVRRRRAKDDPQLVSLTDARKRFLLCYPMPQACAWASAFPLDCQIWLPETSAAPYLEPSANERQAKMQFSDDGPDVPEELIRAQLAGEVVFVVGAGVSSRAGLPLFKGLVKQVYSLVGQGLPGTGASLADVAETAAWNRSEWDRTLGLLEQRLVYPDPNGPELRNIVRDALTEVLKPTGRGLGSHRDILDLSRDRRGRPRIVTTNFDSLFERAWRKERHGLLVSSAGPGLPMVGSADFHGVMHLHGRVADRARRLAESSLVLTSADFGEAYLRSGWASRFVYDLLRRYVLVFVGYSADDPPMRYMLEATEAGRLRFPDLRRAYAFASFDETDPSPEGNVRALWRAKGLVPITYENRDRSHEILYQCLSRWAECARDPAAWATAEIGRLATVPYPDASPVSRRKVRFLTATMANTAILSGFAGSPDWFNTLTDEESRSHPDERDARIWLETRLGDIATTQWALEAQPAIKPMLTRAVQAQLAFAKSPIAETFRRYWRLYVVAFSGKHQTHDAVERIGLRSGLKAGEVDYQTISSVVEVVRPRIQMNRPWHSLYGEKDETQKEDDGITLRQLCEVSFRTQDWPTWKDILATWPNEREGEYRLLQALGRALAETCEQARESDLINENLDRSSRDVQLVHELEPGEVSVEPEREGHGVHWQRSDPDGYGHSFVPIVRLMSGLWRRLAEHDPRRARATARWWMDQDFLLFRRLGYWAATISDAGPIDTAAELLEGLSREAFWLHERTAEAARFWCGRWENLSPSGLYPTLGARV